MLEDKCLCIHELNENIINIINKYDKNVLLTFDDGLYSQFKYKDKINNKNRIYFICPSLVNTKEINDEDVTTYIAMSRHFYYNSNEYYMKLEHIKILIDKGYIIGAHSFYHENVKYKLKRKLNYKNIDISRSFLSIKDENYIKNDTEKLLEWFDKYLNIKPIDYCYPFNNKTDKLESILKAYGFINFYGDKRIII